MSKKVALIYSKSYLDYNFGDAHPFNSLRLKLTLQLCEELGIIKAGDILKPEPATCEELETFHSPDYIKAVSQCKRVGKYGLTNEDNPINPNVHRAASYIVGGSLLAAKLLMEEGFDHVFNIGGGLHHADREFAGGFCIYNDLVIAMMYLQKKYNLRIAYIDLDAHHGDGVQKAFYEDPNIITISIHETGRYLYPGTGSIFERGKNSGYGYSVNIPLEAFSESDSYLYALDNVVYPLLYEFKPDLLVAQCGCDSHLWDPLTHLALTINGFIKIYQKIHAMAHKFTGGKLLCTGGGGYNAWQVVPRAWSALWGELSQRKYDTKIPARLIHSWHTMSGGEQIPNKITDDDSFCISIPRKEEIKEKNIMTVNKVLNGFIFGWKKGL